MALELTKEQRRQLYDALLAAYPSPDMLKIMVSFGLDQNLASIVPSTSLEGMVFDLIEWARQQGRLAELLQAAQQRNADNPLLRAFCATLDAGQPPTPSPPAPPDDADADVGFDW